ncbi:SRPBCC family protein [Candidatus Dependentiae bacterium]|nr:SRPBCC family protein [Candidatus Dependentiae bacterium]
MLIIKHTVETTASPQEIWNIWQDVANWNTWDHGIEYSTIDGPFQEGTTGTLKPKGGSLVHTKLTRVEPLKLFIDESKLPLARIIVSHYMNSSNGFTQVTHQIEMDGPLSFVFAFLIGRTMKKNLPQEMMAMVKKAETGSKTKKLV